LRRNIHKFLSKLKCFLNKPGKAAIRRSDCSLRSYQRPEGHPAVTQIRFSISMLAASSVSALALSAALAPAQAQETADDARVDTIIVTTTRREENIQDVAGSVTAVPAPTLDALTEAGGDILSLAARVPSLYAESSNGRVAPRFYIRGLGNTDFDLAASQPVSIVMDGVVQENVILKSFPLFDIAQVEVSRGPQGTLFGRNTTAGIVKFDSVRPSQETDGYGAVTVGSLGTVNAEAALGGALFGSEVWSGRLSLLSQNRDDWIDNALLGQDDALGGFNELAGRLQLLFAPNDSFDALFNLHGRDLEGTSAVFRSNILTQGSNSLNQDFIRDRVFFNSTFNNPQEYESWGASATFNVYRPGYTITSITGLERAEGFSLGDIDGGSPAGLGFIPFQSETQDGIDTLQQVTQEIRLASDTDGDTSWQVGAYYFDSEFDITTLGPNGGFPPPTTVRHGNELWSLFAQASRQVNDQLELSGGLRFTSDEKDLNVLQSLVPQAPVSASDEQISWDLSAFYDVNDEVSVFARVARGFRGPTIQARDVAFFGSPSVADSETVLSWEAGVKSEPLGGRARINATAFYYTVEDLQLSAVGGAGNLVQLVNADEGVGYGFEVDSEFLVTDNLLVTAGFSWNETELQDPDLEVAPCGSGQCTPLDPDADNDGFVEVDGNPFPQAPDYILSLTARYAIPSSFGGEWFAYTDWFWQGRTNLFIYESEEFFSDGNFEGGLRVGYAGVNNGRDWEAAVFVRNITDEENLVGGIDFNNNTGFVNEPRIWGVSLRSTFN
jgi:outer membrane receptor protein involved in Fe transport